jgi:outer membrane protein assembly factor BamD (BamD/ComL family)
MSLSGVSASSSLTQSVQAWQAKAQKVQSEFQQLGQDLQAGNLTQAQSDFSILNQNISTPMQTNSSISQAFGALGSALQSGNLAAAQKAYTTLEQDVQQAGQSHSHLHARPAADTNNSTSTNPLSQLLATLGSSLQSGNSSTAQSAYSALSQAFQHFGLGAASTAQSLAGSLSFLG